MKSASTSIIVPILLVFGAACVSPNASPTLSYLGKDLEGERVFIDAFRGRTVVVSFWASWCAPCREELPKLEAIQRAYGRDRLVVVAANQGEARRDVRRSVNSWNRELQMLITTDRSERAGRAYKIQGIPTTILVNRDGAVSWQFSGIDEDSFDTLVEKINESISAPSPSS
jgi:thiol-disulfide isomerase/thioredoxin